MAAPLRETTLAAWWSAWKYVAILGVALGLSLWGNLHQYGNSRAAVEKARADVLDDTLKATAGIARQAQTDNADLMRQLGVIVDRGKQTRIIYRQAAADAPLPAQCAPGQARMDAVNNGVPPAPTPGEVR